MNIVQRLSLLYRRFSPLEERLLAAVCEVLPQKARSIFEAQVAGITLVQRLPQWTEIDLYRKQHGKVDWSDVPAFPRTGEFKLAEVKFSVGGRGYKATLTSISGHIFDITVTPSPKAIAFADWDAAPAVGLLSDPLTVTSASEPSPIPELWRQFLTRHQAPARSNWTFYNSETAVRTAIADAEFLVLAEREGDQFVLHRIEPAASYLFYLDSHDGAPQPIKGDLEDVFREK
ncbi:MAG TPA: hypothetical protein VKY92_05845 [Verrucomicrobiae bacterium]|jgi:hypothetical protein|nr:hypothetical protein [Verrucomicrobiae bacterium]